MHFPKPRFQDSECCVYNAKLECYVQRSGAVGACEAHNLEVVRSKLTFATFEISDEISFWLSLSFFYYTNKKNEEMKLVVGLACARTLLSLSKPIQHFAAFQQQYFGHRVSSRLFTSSFKASTTLASASEKSVDVGIALFDATDTLMHLKEPVGETYVRYATRHSLQVGSVSPADLELRFKSTYINTVRLSPTLCVSLY